MAYSLSVELSLKCPNLAQDEDGDSDGGGDDDDDDDDKHHRQS